jgi:ribA/ribD-fused uncharacterized protein
VNVYEMEAPFLPQIWVPRGAVVFQRPSDEYGWLHNFHRKYPFPDRNGVYWPSSEHYYQAQKMIVDEHIEAVRLMPTPMEAKHKAYELINYWDPDWDCEQTRVEAMIEACYLKYKAHPALQALLEKTWTLDLIEASSKDAEWGAIANGMGYFKGKNLLGIVWMYIRTMERLFKERRW